MSNNLYSSAGEYIAAPANGISQNGDVTSRARSTAQSLRPLYTPEQRLRRDATQWTLVQGILAPVQFAVFLISLALVLRYLFTGESFAVATASIVVKTIVLYAIMITGSIWEREVFGCYLFAPAFFWEDVFSFLVLALHTAYLFALFTGLGDPRQQMLLALAAYASYFVNATQFVLKLRAARRDERLALSAASSTPGSRA
ncbi:2-vinyl bacteriochlorophyllide hydratase [Bradyrhizobium cosmicum]|nr:2-vinyl bacteriochlorophyllide hydratase [Bradyrhizobium cosmicum]QDP27095.1 2-vinyl bacteriochlorophyllide hydratase [Bradyrhizobium cosmicum]